jgi:hypothetical protein
MMIASAVPVTEGNPLRFTIKLSRPVPRTVRVKYVTQDATATAGADYTATSGTLELAPNQLSGEIDIPTTGDGLDESDETVLLVLSEAEHAVVAGGGAFAGIINDDDTTQVNAGDASVKEGDDGTTAVGVPVRLTGPATAPVRVGYATADDEAGGGVDYDPVVGEVTFEPGQTEKLVTVKVRGDTAKESDEHFRLELLSADGAVLSRRSGVVTITDDDATPVDRRRKPGGLVIEISPLRDVSAPFVFTVRGRLLRPRKMSVKKACRGNVLLELRLGDKRVARRVTSLSRKTCRFAGRLQLRRLPKGTKVSVLRVQATFQGNKSLQPVKAPSLLARLS